MKQNLLQTMLVGIGLLMGTSAWAEDTYEEVYSRTTTYGADSIWTSDDITAWGGNSNLQISVPTEEGSSSDYHGLLFNPTKPGSSYSATKSFDITDNAKVKYEINWYFGNSTGRESNYEYIQIGDNIRFSWNSKYIVYLTTDGTSATTGTAINLGKGSYTKKIVVIFNTATNSVESLTFGGTDYTSAMPSTLDDSFNSVTFGFVRGGSTSNWAYPNGIQDITVSQCEQSVTTATYTINYKNGDTTVKTVEGSSVVGGTISADSVIYDDSNVRYLISDETAPSMTLINGTNELDVDVRKPYTATFKLTKTIGDTSSTTETTLEETDGKDCSWSYAYSLYEANNGVYYKADNTETFGETGTFTDGETIEKTVTYSTADEDIVFFSEAESASGTTFTYSGGAKGYVDAQNATNRGISVGTLAAGTYSLVANVTANANRNVCVRNASSTDEDTNILATISSTGVQSQNFVLSAETQLIVNGKNSTTAGKSNQSADFDYVLIKKATITEDVSITSETGFATYCPLTLGVTFPSTDATIAAYTATVSSSDESTVTLNRVYSVANGEGVLLHSIAGGKATQTVTLDASATENDGNAFVGATVDTYITTGYVLNYVNDVIGFYAADASANDGQGTKVGAGKAYLNATSSAKGLKMVFDDETNGIVSVKNVKAADNKFYNLNGQRIAQPTKGLYIVNGKKVIVK